HVEFDQAQFAETAGQLAALGGLMEALAGLAPFGAHVDQQAAAVFFGARAGLANDGSGVVARGRRLELERRRLAAAEGERENDQLKSHAQMVTDVSARCGDDR